MRKLTPFILTLFILASCSVSSENEVEKSFSSLRKAISDDKTEVIEDLIPFLTTLPEESREIFLNAVLSAEKPYRYKILSEDTLLIIAENKDDQNLIFPFKKDEDGLWRMTLKVNITESIDVISSE